MDRNETEDRLLRIEEAATYLGLAVGTLYNKVGKGEVPFSRIGRSVRFRRSELDQWIQDHPAPSDVAAAEKVG